MRTLRIVVTERGGLELQAVAEEPLPEPEPGELCLEVGGYNGKVVLVSDE